MKTSYRKLITKRGTYFVLWRPEDVTQLLLNENLAPNELLTSESHENHHLIRDLYLLACICSLRGRNRKGMNLLQQYARKLQTSLSVRH